MISLGLVGKDIQHSRSQLVYESLLHQKIDYHLFDFQDEQSLPDLDSFFQTVQGLSVTSPFKKTFTPQVELFNAPMGIINCIKKVDGTFMATNTDYSALSILLPRLIDKKKPSQIALLGSGPMADIVLAIMNEYSFKCEQYSRRVHGDLSFFDLSHHDLIINACSRGFTFHGKLRKKSIFYNLNYSHDEQESKMSRLDIAYLDGFELLKLQGSHALNFWNVK